MAKITEQEAKDLYDVSTDEWQKDHPLPWPDNDYTKADQ